MLKQHMANPVQQMDEAWSVITGNLEVNHGNASLEDQWSILRNVQL